MLFVTCGQQQCGNFSALDKGMLLAAGGVVLEIAEHVLVRHIPPSRDDPEDKFGQVVLEWESSPMADCTADAVVAVLLQEQGQPVALGAAEDKRKCVLTSSSDLFCF
jgi:hypothetical protein